MGIYLADSLQIEVVCVCVWKKVSDKYNFFGSSWLACQPTQTAASHSQPTFDNRCCCCSAAAAAAAAAHSWLNQIAPSYVMRLIQYLVVVAPVVVSVVTEDGQTVQVVHVVPLALGRHPRSAFQATLANQSYAN